MDADHGLAIAADDLRRTVRGLTHPVGSTGVSGGQATVGKTLHDYHLDGALTSVVASTLRAPTA